MAVSWLVYLVLPEGNVAVRCFFATMVVETLAQIFARVFKAPATIFLIIGIIPLVPGGGIYYTMYALLGGDMQLFAQKGAETALWLARRYGCKAALLKEKSPSCGSGLIYDGSFTGTLVTGDGVAAQMLKEEGLIVFGESDTELLITVFQE